MPWSKVAILGMVIPHLIGILVMGIKTPTIELMTIPYYMEIMGVFTLSHVNLQRCMIELATFSC